MFSKMRPSINTIAPKLSPRHVVLKRRGGKKSVSLMTAVAARQKITTKALISRGETSAQLSINFLGILLSNDVWRRWDLQGRVKRNIWEINQSVGIQKKKTLFSYLPYDLFGPTPKGSRSKGRNHKNLYKYTTCAHLFYFSKLKSPILIKKTFWASTIQVPILVRASDRAESVGMHVFQKMWEMSHWYLPVNMIVSISQYNKIYIVQSLLSLKFCCQVFHLDMHDT